MEGEREREREGEGERETIFNQPQFERENQHCSRCHSSQQRSYTQIQLGWFWIQFEMNV